ncbi:MAG: iron-containing alcohol dehydrogenase [Thermoplasmata archaeon]|nr:iron-containing alcohol dehydrogenase [Thermoplasmata archaeon]
MFKLNTVLHHGRGCLDELKELEGNKAVIFASNSMRKYGFVDEVLSNLSMESVVIDGVKAEPEAEEITKYVNILHEERPDIIVSIGGGSVIDTSKAALYDYKNATLIAIPSTSGSGSEVTAASVIKENGMKKSIVAPYLQPSHAFLDPRLPEKMPSQLAANTGMDALSHALEALVSPLSSPFSDSFAMRAAKIIFENIEKSVNGNEEAREKMHYASCMAGIAILNARVGLCHVLSHKAAIFNLPHGYLNAVFLEHVVEFNRRNEEARNKYRMLEKEMNIDLVDEIRRIKKEIKIIPLKNIVNEKDFMNKLDIISSEASVDNLMKFNPVSADVQEIRKLYMRAYEDAY